MIKISSAFRGLLRLFAFVAVRPRLAGLSALMGKVMATQVIKARKLGRAQNVAELARLWQRAFPSAKQIPIESIDKRTVIAQIHTPCPLKGGGDVHACHRMMAFDRHIAAAGGGQFIVLKSQATPGVGHCRVAMRMAGDDVSDLVPAHQRS